MDMQSFSSQSEHTSMFSTVRCIPMLPYMSMYKPHFFSQIKLKPKIKGAAYPWIYLCLEFSKT